MRFIIRFVNRFLKNDHLQKPTGRWSRDSCENKISRKVDLTNEDHCGPCGQYKIIHMDIHKNKPIENVPITKVVLK